MEGKHSGCEECFGDDEDDFDVDDVDAPNISPYKKCSVCEERKSCGNYDDNKVWFCEDCFPDEEDEEKEEDNDNGCSCERCKKTTCEGDNHYDVRLLWNSNINGKKICRDCVVVEDFLQRLMERCGQVKMVLGSKDGRRI